MVTLSAPLSATLLPQLNNYRLSNFLTDLTISCVHDGGIQESFDCHKIVVSSISQFLAKIIKENPCSHPIIILHSPPPVFAHLLTFVYTGSVTVSDEILSDFLSICDQLGISNNYELSSNNSEASSGVGSKVSHSLLSQALEKPLLPPSSSAIIIPTGGERITPVASITNTNAGGRRSHHHYSPPAESLPPSRSPSPILPFGQSSGDQPPFSIPLLPLFDKPLSTLLFSKSPVTPSGTPTGQQSTQQASPSSSSRIRATDPRPCPKCGKIYRSAHTLRTHLEDKHTSCPGYRCVLCGTVAKSRNSLHSHMSRQHRGISTKELPVVPMPSPFDPILASKLLAKVGREGNVPPPYCETDRTTSSTSSNHSGMGEEGEMSPGESSVMSSTTTSANNNNKRSNNNKHQLSITPIGGQPPSTTASSTGSVILDTYLQFIAENNMFGIPTPPDLITGAGNGGSGFKKFKFGTSNNSNTSEHCIYDSE